MLDKIFGNSAPSYSTGSFLPQDSENGYGQVSAVSGYDVVDISHVFVWVSWFVFTSEEFGHGIINSS